MSPKCLLGVPSSYQNGGILVGVFLPGPGVRVCSATLPSFVHLCVLSQSLVTLKGSMGLVVLHHMAAIGWPDPGSLLAAG